MSDQRSLKNMRSSCRSFGFMREQTGDEVRAEIIDFLGLEDGDSTVIHEDASSAHGAAGAPSLSGHNSNHGIETTLLPALTCTRREQCSSGVDVDGRAKLLEFLADSESDDDMDTSAHPATADEARGFFGSRVVQEKKADVAAYGKEHDTFKQEQSAYRATRLHGTTPTSIDEIFESSDRSIIIESGDTVRRTAQRESIDAV